MVPFGHPGSRERGAVDALALVTGVALITITTADALHTLVVTRLTVHEWWPTDWFYRKGWRLWRRLALRITDEARREVLLGVFAPLSILGLLVAWVSVLIVGWGFVWWALRADVAGVESLGDGIYFSGVVFFSVGFGDVLPQEGLTRVLVLVEAFSGLSSIALVIGYLPSLYSSYRERESLLLTLDDLGNDRMTPLGLVSSVVHDGDLDELYDLFREWERWTASVLESHTAYPMLATFRSQHTGQSWLTALGVVTDAAVACISTIPGADQRSPMRLYRRAARTFDALADRLHVEPSDEVRLTRDMFRDGYALIASKGLATYPEEVAWQRVVRLRATYAPQMEGLIDALLTPRGFWSHPVHDLALPTAAELGEGSRNDP